MSEFASLSSMSAVTVTIIAALTVFLLIVKLFHSFNYVPLAVKFGKHSRSSPSSNTSSSSSSSSWAVVVGAAEGFEDGSGLGVSHAEALAVRGFDLLLLDHKADLLHAFANQLRSKFPNRRVITLVIDLAQLDAPASPLNHSSIVAATSPASADLALRGEGADSDSIKTNLTALQQFQKLVKEIDIGVLIYNAGVGCVGEFRKHDIRRSVQIVNVNCLGVIRLTHSVLEGMIKRERGCLVFMSSGCSLQGGPRITAYAASKSFINVFAEGLWHELLPHGVSVVSVLSGSVRTPSFRTVDTKGRSGEPPGTMDAKDVVEQILHYIEMERTPGPTFVPGWTNRWTLLVLSLLPLKQRLDLFRRHMQHLSDSPQLPDSQQSA